MNSIYEYNDNGKYSAKYLKGSSVTIQLLNIFKDNHMVAKSGPGAVGYDVI